METHDESLRSSEEKDEDSEDDYQPLIPHPDSLELSDEEIRRFQKILNASGGKQYNEVEAKYRGLELLRLTLMMLDPNGYEYHQKHPLPIPGMPIPPPPPDPPPIPQPFPIKLDADHDREIDRALAMLADELKWVKRRPTHWRWALVALYEALGHTLAKHRPPSFLPYSGIGQLTKLFDAVARVRPEIKQNRNAVEEIDRLRTTWIGRAVTKWPVKPRALQAVFSKCTQVIERLGSSTKRPSPNR